MEETHFKVQTATNPLAADLDQVLWHTRPLWEKLRGQRIFITGGTGFFGHWLSESLVWANDRLDLDLKAVLLSRDPAAFARVAPHLADHPCLSFAIGNIRSFEFPSGHFSHVVHAAADGRTYLNQADPIGTFDVLAAGTRRALEFARHCGARKFLLTSSGAIYGPQPADLPFLPEEYTGAPDPTNPSTFYSQGKRAAEFLCAAYHTGFGLETTVARCFGFIGPHLPIDTHFAVGNFIRDALDGQPIRINGDGRPQRSYLYAADLAAWLWTLLLEGQPGRAYNVGSDQPVTIGDVAHAVARCRQPALPVAIAQSPRPGPPPRYIPCIERARRELGLQPWTDLPTAVAKTLAWHQHRLAQALG